MELNEARRRALDEAKRQADIALLSATGKDYLDAAERIKLAVALLRSRCRPLAFLGRHSFVIYLVHQPVLYGLFLLAAQ